MVSTHLQHDIVSMRRSQTRSAERLDVVIAREDALAERFKVRLASCLHVQYAMMSCGPYVFRQSGCLPLRVFSSAMCSSNACYALVCVCVCVNLYVCVRLCARVCVCVCICVNL